MPRPSPSAMQARQESVAADLCLLGIEFLSLSLSFLLEKAELNSPQAISEEGPLLRPGSLIGLSIGTSSGAGCHVDRGYRAANGVWPRVCDHSKHRSDARAQP